MRACVTDSDPLSYPGGQYAVKKTTFRTRECQILMRVEHRNIVPLIALILGEPHPLHRRRTLCYHVMPLMSGVCGVMFLCFCVCLLFDLVETA